MPRPPSTHVVNKGGPAAGPPFFLPGSRALSQDHESKPVLPPFEPSSPFPTAAIGEHPTFGDPALERHGDRGHTAVGCVPPVTRVSTIVRRPSFSRLPAVADIQLEHSCIRKGGLGPFPMWVFGGSIVNLADPPPAGGRKKERVPGGPPSGRARPDQNELGGALRSRPLRRTERALRSRFDRRGTPHRRSVVLRLAFRASPA